MLELELRLNKVTPKVKLMSFRKMTDEAFVVTLDVPPKMDMADALMAFNADSNNGFIVDPASVSHTRDSVYVCVATRSHPIRPFADTASMTLIGRSYVDNAGKLWDVIENGDTRQIVQHSEDDAEEILNNLKTGHTTIDTASLVPEVSHGDLVKAYIKGKVMAGVAMGNYIVDHISGVIAPLKADNAFAVVKTGASIPPVDGIDMASISKTDLKTIFDFLAKVYPADYLAAFRKMVK